ncbi:MAG: TIGR00282 family metallophosphoesterase [Victivallaceae bacterium]|nr:TIGR00282 family metallophosphoesterase [Victivallaceae bacterium]
MNLLFIGDVVGKGGREAVKRLVPELRREFNCSFVVVNAENSAAGNGITGSVASDLLKCADVLTLGDHTWDQKGFDAEIRNLDRIIRPANYSKRQPGRGVGVFRNPASGEVAVISLVGKVFMKDSAYDPFETVDEVLAALPPAVNTILVDFHAEATSEKEAMGYYLDGRVTAVIGTHTHVQTADGCVLPGGTAYLSDAGMVGAARSVLGREVDAVLHKFTTGMPVRFPVEENGPIRLCGAVVGYDSATGRAKSITAISREVTL